ncbi:MAG: tetratricopeptide repeat protein, partial [Ignavibacteriae bacterium]|nr:tetratricopeptide repeat protein [Ignavibacteriota bacterium]
SQENYSENQLAAHALFSAAWVLQQLKEYKRSAESYKQFIVRFSESEFVSTAAIRAGECYFALRDARKTIDHLVRFRSHITRDDEKAEADYLLGESYLSLGDYPNALFSYESFLKKSPDNHLVRAVKYSRGWTFLKEMNYERAMQIFAELQQGTDDVAQGSLFRKGVAQKLAGDRMGAMETFNACFEANTPFSDDALYEIGLLFYEEKDFHGARTAFRELLREHPATNLAVQALRMRGESEVALSDYEAALASFQSVDARKDLLPDFEIDVEFQICWTLVKLKRYAEAAEAYAVFVQKHPTYDKVDEAYFWMGEAYFFSGNIGRAEECYVTVITKYPESKKIPEALYGLGWTYFKTGNCKEAITSLEEAIQMQRLAPDVQFDALLRTGGCYFDAKNYVAAGGAYRTIARRFPEKVASPFILCRLAFCNGEIGDYDDAMDMYEDAMKRWPQSQFIDDALFGKGEVYVKAQDDKKAIEEFRFLIKQFPSSEFVPQSYLYIGDAYMKLNQPKRVAASLEEFLKIHPASSLAGEAKVKLHKTYLALGLKAKAAKLQSEIEARAKEVQ